MLGNYYGESKRGRVPIDPVDLEIVGEAACMKQPSKEDVAAFRAAVSEVDCIHNPATAAMIMKQKCLSLCDAYLALREDYKEANVLLNGYDKLLTKLRDRRDKDQDEIRKFHADNEGLREEVDSLKGEVEEVEMDRGVMITAKGRADKIIESLQADNEALREKLYNAEQTFLHAGEDQ